MTGEPARTTEGSEPAPEGRDGLRLRGSRSSEGSRYFGSDGCAAERQGHDETDGQRHQHAEVGDGPGAGLAILLGLNTRLW
jgi:hypothetical protein